MTNQERGRDVLPIPDRAYMGLVKYDARDPEAVFPKMEMLRPPAGAPNVVVVLLDDVGFGASSTFGGWGLYTKDGKLKYCYNFIGLEHAYVEGRTERSIPYLISLDETLDVGMDAGTPVTDDYPARGNEFNGKINWVQIDLKPDDHSHMIDTDHMAHVRMVKQ